MCRVYGASAQLQSYHIHVGCYTDTGGFFVGFFAEKLSIALWTRAHLHKRRCQHTTIPCWAHTTRKMTSLSAKPVQKALLTSC